MVKGSAPLFLNTRDDPPSIPLTVVLIEWVSVPQETTTEVTFAVTVPVALCTEQETPEGCDFTVTTYWLPLPKSGANSKVPFLLTVRSWSPFICNTVSPLTPVAVPPTFYFFKLQVICMLVISPVTVPEPLVISQVSVVD